MSGKLLFWVLFNVFIALLLALDLGLFHRRQRTIHLQEALAWSLFWLLLAAGFGGALYHFMGSQKTLEFATGYLVEQSLSVDNLFVFLLIFHYFKVEPQFQHKVLFWGILGALVMRGFFILAGSALLAQFHWIIYLFGGFLVYSGGHMMLHAKHEIHPEKNPVLKLFRRIFPVTENLEEGRFLVRRENKWWATPLLVVLVLVETTDVLFATDSIPAVLSITPDPVIVYSSNVFAILGLRSVYFVLEHLLRRLRFLHYAVSALLILMGVKMLSAHLYNISTVVTLAMVAATLALSVILSLMFPEKSLEEDP